MVKIVKTTPVSVHTIDPEIAKWMVYMLEALVGESNPRLCEENEAQFIGTDKHGNKYYCVLVKCSTNMWTWWEILATKLVDTEYVNVDYSVLHYGQVMYNTSKQGGKPIGSPIRFKTDPIFQNTRTPRVVLENLSPRHIGFVSIDDNFCSAEYSEGESSSSQDDSVPFTTEKREDIGKSERVKTAREQAFKEVWNQAMNNEANNLPPVGFVFDRAMRRRPDEEKVIWLQMLCMSINDTQEMPGWKKTFYTLSRLVHPDKINSPNEKLCLFSSQVVDDDKKQVANNRIKELNAINENMKHWGH